MEYNKYQLFRNIRFLLSNLDMKVGKLEAESGNQQGYMSRLERQSNTTEPNLSFVLTAAKLLKVSVEYLCYSNLEEHSAAEDTILRFIDKLKRDTAEDKLVWIKNKDIYYAQISNDVQVKLEDSATGQGYSLYLTDISTDEDKPVVFSDETTELMQLELLDLSSYVKTNSTMFRLEKDVKDKIDDYMKT